MVFKLLFLLSLVLGSVFLNAIGLVEYEDEISSLDKLEWGLQNSFFIRATVYGHPGSFIPAAISNKEAHNELW